MPSISSPASPRERGAADGPEITRALELLGKILAPTTVVTALLFYFGWAGTNALYRSFGIDQTVLGFSTQDYILRSIIVAFEPLRWMLLMVLAGAWIHFAISQLMTSQRETKSPAPVRSLIGLIILIGLGAILASPVAVWLSAQQQAKIPSLLYPAAWTIGVGLTSYGLYLAARWRQLRNGQTVPPVPIVPTGLQRLSLWAVLGLLTLGLFWTVANYADLVGRWNAQQIITRLADLPNVVVYSQDPLSLESSGVTVSQVTTTKGSYQYRYSGLKFLVRSNDKYFLLPANWPSSNPIAIILPDNETIRIEVAPGANFAP